MTIKRVLGVIILIDSMFVYDSPFAVVVAAIVIEFVAIIVNIPSNIKLLNCNFVEQILCIIPNLELAIIIGVLTYSIIYLSKSYKIPFLFRVASLL